jgi:hypothetical protein
MGAEMRDRGVLDSDRVVVIVDITALVPAGSYAAAPRGNPATASADPDGGALSPQRYTPGA